MNRSDRAFTLLEVLTVIMSIAILTMMLIPVAKGVQARAEKARCMNNLKGLSVATNAYVQNHGSWPQIDPKLLTTNYNAYATAWHAALAPYGIGKTNWICPTTQREMRDPDLNDPLNVRMDYTAMPFDANPITPFQWSKHPWFVERSSIHGNGNLIIFTDGTIREALDFMPK